MRNPILNHAGEHPYMLHGSATARSRPSENTFLPTRTDTKTDSKVGQTMYRLASYQMASSAKHTAATTCWLNCHARRLQTGGHAAVMPFIVSLEKGQP
jgi:hypothetical protein